MNTAGSFVVVALDCGAQLLFEAEHFDALVAAFVADKAVTVLLSKIGGGKVIFRSREMVMVDLSTPEDRAAARQIWYSEDEREGDEWKRET